MSLKPCGEARNLTFVVVIVHELIRGHHIQQLQNPADITINRRRAGQHGHGIDSHFAGNLGDTNAGFLNLERVLPQIHAVQTLDSHRSDRRVDVLEKSDALPAS